MIKLPKYKHLLDSFGDYISTDATVVHDGYFSKDGKGRLTNSKSDGTTAADESTYQLIMKDKERLLSFDEPIRFIFSHSALKEGWDNPNVFQVCTLIETKDTMTKRQKVGRGLRICVDQEGNRVIDGRYNVLSVIANESYKEFASTLQKDVKAELEKTNDVAAAAYLGKVIAEKAKAAGLPNDNIKRAIEKGAGTGGAENYEELIYEGYAAGGVAVVVEAMTDNRNRTAGDIRSFFTKFNGNLGETGCVGWMFDKKGCITYSADSTDFDKLFEAAINLDADDIQEEDDEYKVYTSFENLQNVTEGLEKEGFKSVTAEFTRIPQNTIEITDEKVATNIMRLLGRLEEHDDVQNVYANFDIDDELMEKLDI